MPVGSPAALSLVNDAASQTSVQTCKSTRLSDSHSETGHTEGACDGTSPCNAGTTPTKNQPALVPSTLLGRVDLGEDDRATLKHFIVPLGNRTEVDMAELSRRHPELAHRIWRDTQVPKELSTAHLLTSFRQVTSGDRRDLTDQLAQLVKLPGVGDIVNHACATQVDVTWLERTTAALGGTMQYVGDYSSPQVQGALNFTFYLHPAGLPPDLGGPQAEGEHTRQLRVTVAHAAWRDRRARRLASVQSFALVR